VLDVEQLQKDDVSTQIKTIAESNAQEESPQRNWTVAAVFKWATHLIDKDASNLTEVDGETLFLYLQQYPSFPELKEALMKDYQLGAAHGMKLASSLWQLKPPQTQGSPIISLRQEWQEKVWKYTVRVSIVEEDGQEEMSFTGLLIKSDPTSSHNHLLVNAHSFLDDGPTPMPGFPNVFAAAFKVAHENVKNKCHSSRGTKRKRKVQPDADPIKIRVEQLQYVTRGDEKKRGTCSNIKRNYWQK